jgi:ABC-type bacteriocin/lantibiotic exporter with double-glycine peptidase domain
MYADFFKNYYDKNKGLIFADSFITLLIFPIEIIAVSWITGMIFVSIKKKNLSKFWLYIFYFFMVFLIILSLYFISEYLDSIILPTFQKSIKMDIYDLLNNPKVGENQIGSGEIITKILKIPYNMFINYINFTTFIIPFFFGIIFFIGYMFYFNWMIGLFSLIFFVFFDLGFVLYYLSICQIANERFKKEGNVMNHFEDLLKNNENIILNNSFEFEKNIFYKYEDDLNKMQIKELHSINNFKTLFSTILSFFICFIIIYSSFLVIKNKINIPTLIILTTASILMLKSFTSLIRRCGDSIIEFGPTLYDKCFRGSIFKNQIHFGNKSNFFNQFKISIKDLHFSILDKKILNGIYIDIPFKTKILIKGEIGAGKSTLLKLLMGYIKAEKGKIFFDNVDIVDASMLYIRNHVSFMHQSIQMFKRSVLENLFYGIEKNSQQWNILLEQLKSLSVYQHIKGFLNTDDASKLSGGQKQVIFLLRCHFKKCKILLLDEPTASLDAKTKEIVFELLKEIGIDKTIICVSHDSSIESLFPNRYILKNGKLFKNIN